MRKKWTRCALKLYWLRNAPTTTAGIPSRHGAPNSKFPAVVRTHRALVLLAQRIVGGKSSAFQLRRPPRGFCCACCLGCGEAHAADEAAKANHRDSCLIPR